MKKILSLFIFLLGSACFQNQPAVGNHRDANGCIIGAGETWSVLKSACVQPFNEAEIKIPDPNNPNHAIYAMISPDRQLAEVFSAHYQGILESTKGGFSNVDYVLQLRNNQWVFRSKK